MLILVSLFCSLMYFFKVWFKQSQLTGFLLYGGIAVIVSISIVIAAIILSRRGFFLRPSYPYHFPQIVVASSQLHTCNTDD